MSRAFWPQLSSRLSGHLGFGLAIGLGAVLLAWHVASFLPFMADDAFISLRYSQRLVQGQGLTWDEGPRVEGYSNLTWVVLCAALGALGIDLVLAARLLGVLSCGAVVGALALSFRPSRIGNWPFVAGFLGLVVCSPFAAWSIGGLEQPLIAALVAWIVALVGYPDRFSRVPRWSVPILVATLTWSRPDGALVNGLVAAGLLLTGDPWPTRWKQPALIVATALFAFGLQTAFRLAYYDDWIPNPARIKLAFTRVRLYQGWVYLSDAIALLAPQFLALAWMLCRVAVQHVRSRGGLIVTVVAVGWSVYLCFIGGDIFPARRHVVLLLVMGAFAVAELVTWAATKLKGKLLAGLVAGYVGVLAVSQARDLPADYARAERWEWDGQVVGQMLKQAFGDKAPLLAVDPAGCLPYFSGLPSIDMLGLNDRHIAHRPPKDLGRGLLAHEFGDGKYVLSRSPDLALFCLPQGSDRACFRSAAELLAEPEFHRGYRLLTYEGSKPHVFRSRIWTRIESEKIGVQRTPKGIVVPGHLLAGEQGVVARLDARDQLVAALEPKAVAKLKGLSVPAGKYVLSVNGVGVLTVTTDKGFSKAADGELRLELARDTSVELRVAAGDEVANLSRVVLSHAP